MFVHRIAAHAASASTAPDWIAEIVVVGVENHYTAHILLRVRRFRRFRRVCRSVLVRFVIVLILFLIAHLQFFLKNNKIHRPQRGKVLHIYSELGVSGSGSSGNIRVCVCGKFSRQPI